MQETGLFVCLDHSYSVLCYREYVIYSVLYLMFLMYVREGVLGYFSNLAKVFFLSRLLWDIKVHGLLYSN